MNYPRSLWLPKGCHMTSRVSSGVPALSTDLVTSRRRLFIKPGLTDMWQVNGRSDLSRDESVRLDLDYVENWSLTGDLLILWRTFRVMTHPGGASAEVEEETTARPSLPQAAFL